jgi:nicotinamidase/pyrazinamidase
MEVKMNVLNLTKPEKMLFWNVDTQYDFMRSDKSFQGALPIADAREIEINLERLTKTADRFNIKVVNTGDWHTLDDVEISSNPDFKNTYLPHCMIDTKGAQYVPATDPIKPYVVSWQDKSLDKDKLSANRNIVLYKNKFDAFTGNPYTNEILNAINPDVVIVYGVATNVCVDMAVQGLLERKKAVYVVTDAIKELPPEISATPLENILKSWTEKGVKFTTTSKLVDDSYRV